MRLMLPAVRARTMSMPWGRLRVWEGGTGRGRLLAIHGLGGSGRYWAALEPLVGDRFTIVAPDLAGFGGSSKPRVADRALHLATLDAVTSGTERWVVVGHSLGGVLAHLWAGSAPERTAGLAMGAAPYPEPRPDWNPASWRGPKAMIAGAVAATSRVVWPVASLPAQAFSPYPAPVVRDFGRQGFWARTWSWWSLWSDPALEPEVEVAAAAIAGGLPVWLRHARDDRTVKVAALEGWLRVLPSADAARLDHGGHQFLLRSGFAPLAPWLRGLVVTGHG